MVVLVVVRIGIQSGIRIIFCPVRPVITFTLGEVEGRAGVIAVRTVGNPVGLRRRERDLRVGCTLNRLKDRRLPQRNQRVVANTFLEVCVIGLRDLLGVLLRRGIDNQLAFDIVDVRHKQRQLRRETGNRKLPGELLLRENIVLPHAFEAVGELDRLSVFFLLVFGALFRLFGIFALGLLLRLFGRFCLFARFLGRVPFLIRFFDRILSRLLLLHGLRRDLCGFTGFFRRICRLPRLLRLLWFLRSQFFLHREEVFLFLIGQEAALLIDKEVLFQIFRRKDRFQILSRGEHIPVLRENRDREQAQAHQYGQKQAEHPF